MRHAFLLSGMTLLLASSTVPTAQACAFEACSVLAPAAADDGADLRMASSAACEAGEWTEDWIAVPAAGGPGDCSSGVITWGGPVVCNLTTQYECYRGYSDSCETARMCRGADGHLRTDVDEDRDGQCDGDADVDDDNDGVPDECDPHASNQDPLQETADYIDYYVLGPGHC